MVDWQYCIAGDDWVDIEVPGTHIGPAFNPAGARAKRDRLSAMASAETLPVFKYHPDPVATGAFKEDRDTPCLGCSRIRGYIYTGPVFTEGSFTLDNHLCPWCIADGTAAKKFGATFNDT